MVFKLLSLNVWNLNRDYKKRMAELDNYLAETKPDIVCLQEISIEPETGRPQTMELRKFSSIASHLYSSQGKWGNREEGLSTFSRLPIIAFESLMLPDASEDMQRRVQLLVVECEGKKLLIANTHLAYHLDQDNYRVEQCHVIESHLRMAARQQGTDAIILAGDLNSVPSSKPVNLFKNSELALNDVFEDSDERISGFSFPKESPYMDPSLWPDRWIDYIFASNSIIVKSRKLSLNGVKRGGFVSDHVALEATFEL